jgi:transposase InsO family protein
MPHAPKTSANCVWTASTRTTDDSSWPDGSAHGTAVNQRWCGDITYVKTRDGWAYLATVIDLHSRAVVGWAITDHDMALTHRAPQVSFP